EEAPQRASLQELRDDERRLAVGPDVEDHEDVRVVEGPRRPGLLLEAAQPVRVVADGGRQELDRHVAAQARVPRMVDLAHAAGADKAQDLVGSNALATRDAHASGLSRPILRRSGPPGVRQPWRNSRKAKRFAASFPARLRVSSGESRDSPDGS